MLILFLQSYLFFHVSTSISDFVNDVEHDLYCECKGAQTNNIGNQVCERGNCDMDPTTKQCIGNYRIYTSSYETRRCFNPSEKSTSLANVHYREIMVSKILQLINDRTVLSVDLVKSLLGDVFHPNCSLTLFDNNNQIIVGESNVIHGFYKLGFNKIPPSAPDVLYLTDDDTKVLRYQNHFNSLVYATIPTTVMIREHVITSNITLLYNIAIEFDDNSRIISIDVQLNLNGGSLRRLLGTIFISFIGLCVVGSSLYDTYKFCVDANNDDDAIYFPNLYVPIGKILIPNINTVDDAAAAA